MSPVVCFRTDASPSIGTGHVRRCLTLAQGLASRGWETNFAISEETLKTVSVLSRSSFRLIEMQGSPDMEIDAMSRACTDGMDMLVIDHYGCDHIYEISARRFAQHIAVIDDFPLRRHEPDILIDPTLGRQAAEYSSFVPAAARICAGRQFIMLRDEIRKLGGCVKSAPQKVNHIVIAYGGSDPDNLTARAMKAVADNRFEDIEVTVIAGPGNPYNEELAALASGRIRVLVDPPHLPVVMAAADMALAGSGTMAWEFAYLGVPMLLAVNSEGGVVPALVSAGAARSLGAADDVTAGAIAYAVLDLMDDVLSREAMSIAGRSVVDGKGADRVVQALAEMSE